MNRLMRPTLLTFVVSIVAWGLIAVWDEDSRAIASWMLTWQRIALDVAIVLGAGDACAARVYGLGEAQSLVQTCPVGLCDGNRRPTFAELLIDCEENRTLRAVLVGMLREGERRGR